jgi:hypothetical protein
MFKNTMNSMLCTLCAGLLFLAACGSGSSDTANPPNTDPPAPTAPAITTQPADREVSEGQTATFTVVATGTAPLSYQWQRNGSNIGTNAASYTTPATTLADHGAIFRVVVSNAAGQIQSQVATLSVNAGGPIAPAITTQPSAQEVSVGQAATFTVVASGTAPLAYQWQRNGTNIGTNASSYTTPATTLADHGAVFRVQVSNVAGQVWSQSVALSVVSASTSNYYVSTAGDDDADGRTAQTAWRTLAKVNATTFQPGDAILFRRGDTWRDTPLLVTTSGTSAKPIVYGAYGSGAKPGIYGSLQATGWSQVSGNIWSSAAMIPEDPMGIGYDGPEIFFEEQDQRTSWGLRRDYSANLSNLTQEYDWTWNGQRVYVYSSANPGTRYHSVEVPQAVNGIHLQDHNYITIDNLAIKYYADAGIYDAYETQVLHGLRVTNCEIAYIGVKGGSAAYGLSVHQSDAYYAYNEIHNCGRRGISLNVYNTTAITQANVIIEHNHFHHGWHTTSLDAATTGGHTIENIHFRNNLVEGDPSIVLDAENPNSNHIYVNDESDGSGTVRGFYFYNNIFTYASGSSIKIGEVDDVQVYNNTFYNFNPTLANWQAHVYTSDTTHLVILNNVFHSNSVDNSKACVKIDESNRANVTIDRNLYFQSATGTRFMWINGGTSYPVGSWAAYKTATGFDAHSPAPANPLFVNAPADFSLGSGSPALGAGIALDLFSTDYSDNPMNTPPDLGALQH